MLLTITTTHSPATDLGYLLHKHPERVQSFELTFGEAHVFYPEVSAERTTAALLLDVDPIGLVRGKGSDQNSLLGHYVNDRPYVASSFMSVAIAQVFGSALAGRCKDREELVGQPVPLSATIDVLPVRGGERLVHQIFEPLGYSVEVSGLPLDERFPEWGDSPYHRVTITATRTLAELLTHLYVLIPVFDNNKHYFVGQDELEKLLARGGSWLAEHPDKELITRRYLRHRSNLYREALARLADEVADAEAEADRPAIEDALDESLSLHEQRHGAVLAALRASGARSVIDLGCGEGKLLRELLVDRQFTSIVGVDVTHRTLEIARKRLRLDRLPELHADRLRLVHSSLIYRDDRFAGFDVAAVVEVIEHLDPPRLASFERVLFEFARPKTIILTTPNCEYNVRWESLPAGQFRHSDHRFEWTRAEFTEWANRAAERFGYATRFIPIGPVDEDVGAPTQMAVFERKDEGGRMKDESGRGERHLRLEH